MSVGHWVIERGGRRLLKTKLGGRRTRIGSDAGNEIVLEGEAIPPEAAILMLDPGGQVSVRMLTDGAEPSDLPVEPGFSFSIGDYLLRFEAAPRRPDIQVTAPLGSDAPEIGPLRLDLPDGPVEIGPKDGVSLGRDDSNALVIDDGIVSGFHCQLEVQAGRWRVSDLGSTNGTFLDGVRIDSAVLPRAGLLTLGNVRISFEVAGLPSVASVEPEQSYESYGMVGRSSAMQAVFREIKVVASLDEPVLVQGETGTGKELVARAIHEASHRRRRRFLARNCGAIPETLADAELFGSRKGAFSGAVDKPGVFEGAAGGTVFLDEIGELPLAIQPKLLRVLQERRASRLGDLSDTEVNFRLVAATHRNLSAMAEAGAFREDLLHRVSVFTIRLPPLRERRDDIPLLANHLLEGTDGVLTEAAEAQLSAHDWPGNVRELRNTLIRANAFRSGTRIDVADLHLPPTAPQKLPAQRSQKPRKMNDLRDEAVREETFKVWEECGRSVSRAAARLGIAKSTMHRRKAVYGLPDPDA